MLRQKWNRDWRFMEGTQDPMRAALHEGGESDQYVQLPHDAMIHEKRCEDAPAKGQTGFFPGGKYLYLKKLDVPDDWKEETVTLEFEGVYGETKVFVNGEYAGGNHNGYTGFYINLDRYLKYGEENEIKVDVNNTMQPNSRWYSGSGIYRNVNLLRSSPLHIAMNGVQVTTPDVGGQWAVMLAAVRIENEERGRRKLNLRTEIYDGRGIKVSEDVLRVTVYGNSSVNTRQRLLIREPEVWDCDTPNLYTCRVSIVDGGDVIDREEITFGIRSLSLNPEKGLLLNGKAIKLRGACIHHDNGVIGACTLAGAEERRCRKLKEAGFNCIRSSHHPMSRAMLDACDRIGMLVMDELGDMWHNSKSTNDYSIFFEDFWEKDVKAMIEKDFNHPSVILYSTGNEIPEIATEGAADMNRRISDKIRELDDTRYTTNAMNGMFAAGSRMREIFGDILKNVPGGIESIRKSKEERPVGADEGITSQVNSALSIMTGPLADAFAAHPVMTELLEEFSGTVDLPGFNYLTGRHVLEHELHPNRAVLGAETYPSDIARLWGLVEQYPHMIGDMTWTGYDYLGEAGIGIFYYDGRAGFSANWPSSVAYIGDIDITGYRRPVSYLREIVYGLRKKPYIAVRRVDKYGMLYNKTAWMTEDQIASWTWDGFEGKPAVVDVFSDAPEVELFLNGVSLGRKETGAENGFTAAFDITYQPGTLEAVAYRNGAACERHSLRTAGKVLKLAAIPEKTELKADGEDLCYISIEMTDGNGTLNLQETKLVAVEMEGPAVIQGYGSANPVTLEHYDDRVWSTYDGRLLAVVRAGYEAGEVKVVFHAEGLEDETVLLSIG